MFSSEEEFLEPLARSVRFSEAFRHIPNGRAISLVDMGCGPKIRAYHALKKRGVNFKKYIGIDPCISKSTLKNHVNDQTVELVDKEFEKKIPLADESADCIISLAVLEHIDHPQDILNDIPRVLKKGGVAILTTPTPIAKKLLEFLSYKLKLISEREIKEHKNYFLKKHLLALMSQEKKVKVSHSYFEMGLNNLLVIKKQ